MEIYTKQVIDREARAFRRFRDQVDYLQFLEKSPEELINCPVTMTMEITAASSRASEYFNVHPESYVVDLCVGNTVVMYWTYFSTRITNAIVEALCEEN